MSSSKKSIMYNFSLFTIGCLSLISYSNTGYATNKKDPMAIWPKAESGYKQIVLNLPNIPNEDFYRIELIPEKTMKTDCNHVMINGVMEVKPLTGWGYEYYVLSKVNEPASTRMACIPQTIKTKEIAIQTNLPLINYNSKLPLVVYIPKEIRLSYRIWSAGNLQNTELNNTNSK